VLKILCRPHRRESPWLISIRVFKLASIRSRDVGLTDIGLGGQFLLCVRPALSRASASLAEQNLMAFPGCGRAGSRRAHVFRIASSALWNLRIAFPQSDNVIANLFAAGNSRFAVSHAKNLGYLDWNFKIFASVARQHVSRFRVQEYRPRVQSHSDGIGRCRHGSQSRLATARSMAFRPIAVEGQSWQPHRFERKVRVVQRGPE